MEKIEAVGFDLDGTLYKSTIEIDNRIRTKISEKILEKRPELQNIKNARNFFERRYLELQSGAIILREVGYNNAREIIDYCIATADVSDLIQKDEELARIIEGISLAYYTYLLTASPREAAIQKLERLSINAEVFDIMLFSDTPNMGGKSSGSAFKYIIEKSSIPAEKHIYIGDRLKTDILPAKDLGMKTIAVWSEIPEADFSIKHIYNIKGLL